MSEKNAVLICDVCGRSGMLYVFADHVKLGISGHWWCLLKTQERVARGTFDSLSFFSVEVV